MTANEVRSQIATELRDRRMTATTLAELTGVARPNVSRYLASEPMTVSANVFKMLEVLDLELVVRPKKSREVS